jgi:DNA-binding CsgD family transcriptional regulator
MRTNAPTIVLVHSTDVAGIGDVIRNVTDRGFVTLGGQKRGTSHAGGAEAPGTNVAGAKVAGAKTPGAAIPGRLVDRGSEPVEDAAADDPVAGGDALAVQYAHWGRAVLLNGLGRYDDALVAARLATERTPELFLSAWVLPELIEAATRTGHDDLARAAFARLTAAASSAGEDWALGIEARSRALLSSGADADALYREAIERLSRTQHRPELARAHLLYGEWLRRQGRRVDARAELRAAHDMLATIGMAAFAERAHRELLATGEHVRKRSVETLAVLTPQEEQIARLARDGLSNQEISAQLFLSPRTVEWHLRKVFGKLDVSSRRDLRKALPLPGSVPLTV